MTMTFAKTAILATGALAAVVTTATVSPEQAQAAQCGPRDKVVERITGKAGAQRQALGLSGQTSMVELYVATNGRWVMTVTRPDKLTCVLAAGSSWESVPMKVAIGPSV